MKRYRLADLTADEIRKLCHRNPLQDETILETCRRVFQDVESRGDEAVRQYTAQFDKVELDRFEVDDDEWEAAGKAVDPEVHRALEQAASNISKFHVTQLTAPNEVAVQEGVVCWRESRPIDPVGLYIPGGNAVLPSSVLMLGIPATLAGCRSVVLAVPPRSDGSVAPEVLAAAAIAGIKRVFKIGGAQAIAAMTIGTETVPAVA